LNLAGIDEDRLKRAFLEEAEDLTQKLSDSLMALEENQSDAGLINEIFRLTHSLKSESALMGFQTLAGVSHKMEDVFGRVRGGELALDRTVMDRIFAGSDLIAAMIQGIAKGGNDADFSPGPVLEGLQEYAEPAGKAAPAKARTGPAEAGASAPAQAAEAGAPAETAAGTADASGTPAAAEARAPREAAFEPGDFERQQMREARDRGETLYRITVEIDDDAAMKFPRAYLVFNNLELLVNLLHVDPPMDGAMADDGVYGKITAWFTSAGTREKIRECTDVDQIKAVDLAPLEYADLLDRAALAPAGSGDGRPKSGQTAFAPEPAPSTERRAVLEKPTIRVDTRKLDDLWRMVADLILQKAAVGRIYDKVAHAEEPHALQEELGAVVDAFEKIVGGLQATMMETRMIPIAVIFSKFPRLVRDLSRKLGKSVDLVTEGEDTEIDRSIVELLADPLTHIIRNSLDHGIEFAEERVSHGKPAKGRIRIAASQQGGQIVIELADDGKGFDEQGIRRKAAAMGIERAATMDREEALKLVFLPGFSTKEAVTDLSGRGVGMDVVATRIREDLKGEVQLSTRAGEGTQITLLLPLTLTIVRSLLVRADNHIFAVPAVAVETTQKVLASELRGDSAAPFLPMEDGERPVFFLNSLLERPARRAEEYDTVMIRHGNNRGCLVVDELLQEMELVIKPIDDLLNFRRLFSGISLREDGSIVFILDTSFIRRRENNGRQDPDR